MGLRVQAERGRRGVVVVVVAVKRGGVAARRARGAPAGGRGVASRTEAVDAGVQRGRGTAAPRAPAAARARDAAAEAAADAAATSFAGAVDDAAETDDYVRALGGAFWRPGPGGLYKFDAATGEQLAVLEEDGLDDVNHAQLLAGGAGDAVLSGRKSNAFARVGMRASRDARWVRRRGRHARDRGRDGRRAARVGAGGGQPWSGQHNVEYFGDGEYFLFDNQFDALAQRYLNESAQLLVVKVDEARASAEVVAPRARPPERHLRRRRPAADGQRARERVAARATSRAARAAQYDARVLELTRDTHEVALELTVAGPECAHAACADRSPDGGVPTGWSMYSVERFFFAPLVYGVMREQHARAADARRHQGVARRARHGRRARRGRPHARGRRVPLGATGW